MRFAGATLTISLEAIADNWRRLRGMANKSAGVDCAAVVKADAYGLGAERVVPRLYREGCRHFFVAHPGEALTIRPHLPEATVYVLNGLMPGCAADYGACGLVPVLNNPDQVAEWTAWRQQAVGREGTEDRAFPAALHVDTGMTRLGMSVAEAAALAEDADTRDALGLCLIMSHLACADEPDHPLNREQRDRFGPIRARFANAPASLANSSGIFLGPDWHHDLLRPGVALYGGNPTPEKDNPMTPVVRLTARILQLKSIDPPATVGYGGTWQAARKTRVATIAVGYADGLWRSLGGRAVFRLGGHPVPVIGRVSMDLITLDVTDVPEEYVCLGAEIDLLDAHHTVDDLAAAANTIGYETLTSLGRRYHRRYVEHAVA